MDNIIKYVDNWIINGISMNGELIINKNSGEIELSLFYKNDNNVKFNRYYDYITTDINSYNKITLVECYLINTIDSNELDYEKDEYILKFKYIFKISYCIDKYKLENENLYFDKIGVNFSYLFNWGDINKYELSTDENHDIILHSKIIDKQTIYECKDFKIYYTIHNGKNSHFSNSETYSITQIPYIIIESESKPIEFFMDIIIKFMSIIQIAIGKNVFIEDIICGIEHKQYTIHHPYSQKEISKIYDHNIMFNMTDFINNADISRWFEIYEDIKIIVDWYSENISNDFLSIENKFINALIALESYHSKFICKGNKNINSFKKNYIERRDDDTFNRLYKDIITKKTKNITLKIRLLDLTYSNEIIFGFNSFSSVLDFATKVSNTRNYIVHNDKNDEKVVYEAYELYKVYYFLMQILNYYILKELNFDDECMEKIRVKLKQSIPYIYYYKEGK
jgi:hypothetical protein